MTKKSVLSIKSKSRRHWVGNGFPVQSLFSYDDRGAEISPFLLLDYASPWNFEPSDQPRGVESHPHRGFETVTIVYQGEVEHKDNAGNSGRIGPGDVQWMTAGRGILHEEKHGQDFTTKGGVFEVAQLWVNLPAEHKMTAPAYQELLAESIPTLTNQKGVKVRVIAGSYDDAKGSAKTFTPVNLWDAHVDAGASFDFSLPKGHTAMILLRRGEVVLDDQKANPGELITLSREGENVKIEALQNSDLLIMSGAPIDEPIAGYGPFVMNTQEEIRQAIEDFRAGKF